MPPPTTTALLATNLVMQYLLLWNTADGQFTLDATNTAHDNVAVGYNALTNNTSGASNTAVGKAALTSKCGTTNVAIGIDALATSTTVCE